MNDKWNGECIENNDNASVKIISIAMVIPRGKQWGRWLDRLLQRAHLFATPCRWTGRLATAVLLL